MTATEAGLAVATADNINTGIINQCSVEDKLAALVPLDSHEDSNGLIGSSRECEVQVAKFPNPDSPGVPRLRS
jgi:hypothetical protein